MHDLFSAPDLAGLAPEQTPELEQEQEQEQEQVVNNEIPDIIKANHVNMVLLSIR